MLKKYYYQLAAIFTTGLFQESFRIVTEYATLAKNKRPDGQALSSFCIR